MLEFKYPSFESADLSDEEISMLLNGPSNRAAAPEDVPAEPPTDDPVPAEPPTDILAAFLAEPMEELPQTDIAFPEDLEAYWTDLQPDITEDTTADPPVEDKESSDRPAPAKKRTRLTYYALIMIFASIFLLCAVYLGKYFTEAYSTAAQYDQLANLRDQASKETTPTDPSDPSTDHTDPTVPGQTEPLVMLPEMKVIYDLNSDLVGWIQIPRLRIDYPVMQTPSNPDFYLYRDFYKNNNDTGCLYVREACDVLKPSDNVVIYGHAMKTGDMFGRLYNYRTKSFWEEYQYFTFDTLYEHHTYQIFAVFVTSGTQRDDNGNPVGYPYHRLNDFKDAASFDAFIADVKGAAFTGDSPYVGYIFYDTGITPQYGDKIVCLSTCEYTIDNGRLVVMGVRVS